MNVELIDLSFNYGAIPALQHITLRLNPQIIAVLGPNGAGKSTLIKCLAGILHPSGVIKCDGANLSRANRHEYIAAMSYLPQLLPTHSLLTVFEAVLLGLLDTLSWVVSTVEIDKVNSVLAHLNLLSIAERTLGELSGGQQQMVLVAQAMIKDPQILLLDEPLNSLDIYHQFEVLKTIQHVTEISGAVTVVALHDLNLAARYANEVIILKDGRLVAHGTPADVLTAEMIRTVYCVDAEVRIDLRGIPTINMLDII